MDVIISRPYFGDFDAINKLFSVTVENNFLEEQIADPNGKLLANIISDLSETIKKDFETMGKSEFHLVAKISDSIIGVIAFGKPNQIIVDNVDLDFINTPEIKSVYVLPIFQNMGVGNLLLRSILNRLTEKGYKQFCLDSGYKNAQRYWKRKFGKPIKTLTDYWGPNGHHMIWYVKLENAEELSKAS